MKNKVLLSAIIAFPVLFASCAKDETMVKNSGNASPQMHLKISGLPITFGELGTVQLTEYTPTKAQTTYTYSITGGSSTIEKLDLGIQICRLSPEVISVTGASTSYSGESALKKYPEYKTTTWLKLVTQVPVGETVLITFTLKGYWYVAARKCILFGTSGFDTAEGLEVPACLNGSTLATVETTSVTPISGGLVVSGEVEDDGGSEVYERGIIYSYDVMPDPMFNDVTSVKDEGIGLGSFTITLENMDLSKTIFVIAYAKNRCTSCFGDENITCGSVLKYPENAINYGDPLTDGRDQKTYRTIQIGEQTWMADNVAYMPDNNWFYRKINRKNIEFSGIYVYGYMGTSAAEAKQTDNYQKYGCLYDWERARTACPVGWKLPSDEDWQELEHFLGMSEDELGIFDPPERNTGQVAAKLKSNLTDDWFWNLASCIMPGNNLSGFTAVGSGRTIRYSENLSFTWEGQDAIFWTSTMTPGGPVYRDLKLGGLGVIRRAGSIDTGFSVRCVKE